MGVVAGVDKKVREVVTEVAAEVGASVSGVNRRSRSDVWVSNGGRMVRLLGELVTSFNPEPSSSLRLLLSFTLVLPTSASSITTSLSIVFDFLSFLSFLGRGSKSSSSEGPNPALIISSTSLSSSSSASPAFLRCGEPRAGLDALGCTGPSSLSDLIDVPTSVLTESSPLCLRLVLRFREDDDDDDSRSTKLTWSGVSNGGRGGTGTREDDNDDDDDVGRSFVRRRAAAEELTCTTSSSSASREEDPTSSSSWIPGKFGARESRGIWGDEF